MVGQPGLGPPTSLLPPEAVLNLPKDYPFHEKPLSRHTADKWVRRAAGPYLSIIMDDIGRKRLPHDGLSLNPTSAEGEVYFITICCIPRNINPLATSEAWQAIAATLAVREVHGDMTCRLALAMPDHLHGLFGFPGSKPMPKVVADLKSWLAKQCGIQWQRDFFDHRLRNLESADEKAKYIRLKPVRAGLVTNPEDWPYQR